MLSGERTFARPHAILLISLLVVVASTISFAEGAHAKSRRRAVPTGPLKVVVIPFEAPGAIAYEVPQQLELELELNESVTVVGSARTWAELKKQGKDKFERKRLQKVMQRRGVDVLVRGVQGFDDDGEAALHVLLYGNDGRVRFQGTISESQNSPEELVGAIAAVVETPLSRFASLAAIEPVFPEKRSKRVAEKTARVIDKEPPPDDSVLFSELEADKSKKKKEPAEKPARATLDEEPAAPKTRASPRRALADDGDAPAKSRAVPSAAKAAPSSNAEDDPVESARPRRRRFDDDGEADDKAARSASAARTRFLEEDDVEEPRRGRDRRSRATMADVVDKAEDGTAPPKLSHLFSLSLGGGAATWFYDFAGNKPAQSFSFSGAVFPGATLRADLWPIEWVGVDIDAHFQGVRFNIDDPTNTIRPDTLFAWRYGASAAAKGRYIFHLGNVGIGAGGRVGYRLLGVMTENQTHVDDGDFFTLIPGYMFNTIFVGGELYGAVVFLDRRLELELKVDGLPLTRYEEFPDSPGSTWVAFGWATTATARMEIFYGAYTELYLFHSGGIATFDGVGNRRGNNIDSTTGKRERIEGGRVATVDATMGLALGWMW